MKTACKICLLFLLFLSFFVSPAQAKIRNYTYSYDISQIEWQILNWTAAYRGTTTPANPFILERFDYDRSQRRVIVYLNGDLSAATEENLQKSVNGIGNLFNSRLPDFDPSTDAVVYYTLKTAPAQPPVYKEYKDGVFLDRQSPPEEFKSDLPDMAPQASD